MLDESVFAELVGRALRRGGDFADVFCEHRRTLSYRLQDGRIHDASYGVTLGVGVRVVVGESAGYAYSDDLGDDALKATADAASLIARSAPAGQAGCSALRAEGVASLYHRDPAESVNPERYVALLDRADATARRCDSRGAAIRARRTYRKRYLAR